MSKHHCPDCNSPLAPIGWLGLTYASPGAKPNIWTGAIPVEGSIHGFLCSECGRVILYAERPVDSLPLPADAARPSASALPLPASGDVRDSPE